ncbi:phosphoribosyl-ATP pyrophosphatase [Magnetococcus marinus MC-1]|uniref:Phosphoribosyl-ATP pyrophosphatase n=1 Tax=Magnetococcus marinus (strain ATCC BAA-1437 / JCM 17883 / MC-1) TaxID=156889 RepID=HIS2_MAGMM|nr:phosphoribosyl-ATP diphosphatase [Magnetococcus marinus]A0LCF5.1 RecName: Full=Phosphoribosyl-ATP pyrophosphatase; Short=PRA-PH [Magnetococcus marinus MC-1]ABK45648.1 phosphoribosyl-ATP pyrophosphatase [Magnetococcus marinus MC-1]
MNNLSPPSTVDILEQVYQVIQQRKSAPDPEASYVAKLFHKGDDAILKKVGEEATELVLAIKGRAARNEVAHEAADLIFHTLVGLAIMNIPPTEVMNVLSSRFGKTGLTRNQTPSVELEPSRRQFERRLHSKTIHLIFSSGITIDGLTRDISLDGMQLHVDYADKVRLLGEKGYFELSVQNKATFNANNLLVGLEIPTTMDNNPLMAAVHSARTYRFEFEIVRVTEDAIGLRIIGDKGMFSFALANEVFNDLM